MNNKFNGSYKNFLGGMLIFAFAMLTSFLLTFANYSMVSAEEPLGTPAVYFIKGEEADFDGVIRFDDMDYYNSNIREAIQSTGNARAYLILPDGFDTIKTKYQYLVTKTDQPPFTTEYDSNEHESWMSISESGFVTLEGFDQGEGNYYVHVRYKLIGSDEIYLATSTNIVVDNTAPGLDATWDPTTPTDTSVTILPLVTGIYKYDTDDMDISSLEFIGYKKGSYDSYAAYLGASELHVDLTPEELKTTDKFTFETTSNGTYTICISDRAGNISLKLVTINNIYKNLKLQYVGTLSQEVNSVSNIQFGVTGDELGDLSRVEWYLTTDGNEELILEGVDVYTHVMENRVAKYSIRIKIKESMISAAKVDFEVTPKKLVSSDIAWDALSISKIYDGNDDVLQTVNNFGVKAEVLGSLDKVALAILDLYYETIHVSNEIKVYATFSISGDDATQFDFSHLLSDGSYRILISTTGAITVRTINVTLSADDRNYNGSPLVEIKNKVMENLVDADKSKLSLSVYSSASKGDLGYGKMTTADAGNDKVVSVFVELNSTDEVLLSDYTLNVAELRINVLKIAVQITLADVEVSYGDAIEYKVTSTDYSSLIVEEGKLVGTEKLDTIGYDFSMIEINGGVELPKNVGVYDISLDGQVETTNYTYTYVGGTLSINAIELSVILKDTVTGKKYDGIDEYTNLQDPSLYDFDTLVLGDEAYLSKVIYSPVVMVIKNVGVYSIEVSAIEFTDPELANNYIVTSELKEYVIERKLIELVVEVEDKTYDATTNINVVRCVFNNLVDGEELNISCPAASFKTNDANVAYDGNNVTSKPVNYDLVVSSTATALVGNYEWYGIGGAVVNTESDDYRIEVNATINPRVIDLKDYEFITKSYDGTALVKTGSELLAVNLGNSITEEVSLNWDANETGYATLNKSEGYEIVVTLSNPKLIDYMTYKASNYAILSPNTYGEITPVKVYVEFIKVDGEDLTIVYDAQVHKFNSYEFYTYRYENEGVSLNGNENLYVTTVAYEAYRDELLTDRVANNDIIDINMDASKNVLPYFIKITDVVLSGPEPVNNYEFVFENLGRIVISKQPLQVTFKGSVRDYVGREMVNEFGVQDFKIVGLLGSEEHDMTSYISAIQYTFYTSAECLPSQEISNPVNVGVYYVVGTVLTPVGGFDLSNYDVTYFKTGTLTINKVSLNVHYVNNTGDIAYSGNDTVLDSTDFTYEGLVGEDLSRISEITVLYNIDGISSTLTKMIDVKRSEGYEASSGLNTNVLSYIIEVTEASSTFTSNYNITYTVDVVGSNAITIVPLELVLTITPIDRDYNTTSVVEFVEHTQDTPRYTGTIAGESFTIRYLNGTSIDVDGNEIASVGTHSVAFNLDVVANDPTKASNYYWDTPVNPTVVISPKELTVEDFVTTHVCDSNPSKKCKVYDGTSAIPSDFVISATEESGVFESDEVVIAFELNNSKFVTVEDKNVEAINAGNAIMIINGITVVENDNYIITVGQDSWEYDAIITKRALDVEQFEVNNKVIVKDYDGTVKFDDLSVVVTVESGLQERNGVLDTVSVIATAVYNDADVVDANQLIITITAITGDHSANYDLSALSTIRENGEAGYEVRIEALVIVDADIKVEAVEKIYDAKVTVPTGFVAYAENLSWPNPTLDLVGYTARYESANASNTATIIISELSCENTNYVIDITDNTVTRPGIINKRVIHLSSLVITQMTKTFDGNAILDLQGITVPDSYIQKNINGTADAVTIISPAFGTFVELSGPDYVESPTVGKNKLLRLNDISLDDESAVNYLLVDDENNEAISYIYGGAEIMALDVYITFNGGSSIYNGAIVDVTPISYYTITVQEGYTMPTEIANLTNITPIITLNSEVVSNIINVGIYTVLPDETKVNVTNKDNYNFNVTEGIYEVIKRSATISLKEGLSSVYNGEEVDLTNISNWNIEARDDAANTGFVNSISSVTPDAGAGVVIKDATTYYITPGIINGIDTNNYSIVTGNAVVYVVEQKTVNVTVTITNREYDGTKIIDKDLINVVLNASDFVKEETLTFAVSSGRISDPDASATAYEVNGYTITLLDGTNGGYARNYKVGLYGNEDVTITPRTITLNNLFLEDTTVLYKTYDGTVDFMETLTILVVEEVDGGLVIREGSDSFDVVVIGYDTTTIAYNSAFVGAGNFVKVTGLTVDNPNYTLEATETTFTHSDGSLIIKKMLIPQNFIVTPNTKVYDGLVDETANVSVTAVGLVDGDVALIGVAIESAILNSRLVGTRVLKVVNISLYDVDGSTPRIYNYDLDPTAAESEFEYIITAKPVDANDVEAYYNEALISHSNPLRMPYIPSNNVYDDIDLVTLKFKEGVIVHEEDTYSLEVTNIEFLKLDDTPAYDVNAKASVFYKVKISFNATVNDNYEFDDSITFIVIDNSGIIDPMGVVVKAKEFTKIYGDSEVGHDYHNPTNYTWVYYDGGNEIGSDDYTYLMNAIGFTATRNITKETQQVSDTSYPINISWDESKTDNYNIIVEDITLRILPRELKVKANDTSIEYYSDQSLNLTYDFLDGTSLVIWDEATALPSSTGVQDTLTNVLTVLDADLNVVKVPYSYGEYRITKHALADENTNYSITVVDGKLNVTDDKESIIENITASGWSNVSVTVTFTATDVIPDLIGTPSGIDNSNVYYCNNEGKNCVAVTYDVDKFTFNVTENGEYIIKVSDKAGNVKTESVSVYTVLTIAPDFDIVTEYQEGHYINEDLDIAIEAVATTTYYFNEEYFATVCVSVDGSECTQIGEKVYGENLSSIFTAEFAYTFSSNVSGVHTVKFTLTDAAGNTREKTLTIKTIYVSTTESLSVNEEIMNVDFNFNNYDKVETMITTFELKYFFSRQYSSSKPTTDAFNAHGVVFDITNGGTKLSSPAGLNGSYRVNVLLKVKVSDGVYDYLIYQSGTKTIKRLSSQPVSLNLSNIVESNDNGMVASYLSTTGSSVIVSNQKDVVTTLSTAEKTYDFVIKYDSYGNEIYRIKLVVDGTYEIVDVVEDGEKAYLLMSGTVNTVNNIQLSGENGAIVLVIDSTGVVDSYSYELGLNGQIKGVAVSDGKVVMIGQFDADAVVIFTDFTSTWTKVIPNSSYEDVAINDEMVIVVGSTCETQFNIDDVIYNGGVVSHGLSDGIMISFNLTGKVKYVKRLSSEGDDNINHIAIDDNRIVVTGTSTGKMMYYSRFAGITTGANGDKNAFIITYDLSGHFGEFSTLAGEGDEVFNSLSLSMDMIVTSVKTSSGTVTPLTRSGSPIIIDGDGNKGFIITYNSGLSIEDVAAGSSVYAISLASLNKETSQLMILSNTETSYVLQTQRFVVVSDIKVTRNDSTISVSADGINMKEVRVMKDGKFVDVTDNQFEVLENGIYDISVIDEYDRVATMRYEVDSFTVESAAIKSTNAGLNSIDYAIIVIGLFMLISAVVVGRRKENA